MLDYISQKESKVAIYGLSTETERFITEHGDGLNIAGLLDGFRDSGEMYGQEIISFDKAVAAGIKTIIVVARPGSCKAIAKRIGAKCEALGISVLDVRGKDLLQKSKVSYDFKAVEAGTSTELIQKIDMADAVSFDLFDTLVTRKVFGYTDVFELVGSRLKVDGHGKPDFANRRLKAEKELSTEYAPLLAQIYSRVIDDYVLEMSEARCIDGVSSEDTWLSPREMADIEWDIDSSLVMKREGISEAFDYAVAHKKVYITTDCYYTKEQLEGILNRLGFVGYTDILISSSYGIAKNQGLFEVLKDKVSEELLLDREPRILHVGDDEYADVEMAKKSGLETFKVLNGRDFFFAMGGMGIEEHVCSLSDRVKIGMVLSKMFSDTFCFEKHEGKLCIESAKELGYQLLGSMIADFVHWFRNRVQTDKIDLILFCARDGYLLKKLYSQIDDKTKAVYFLTSRTAAIRAGMDSAEDVEYVDSMRFFGEDRKALLVRFGIDEELENADIRTARIIERSKQQRYNYGKYIEKHDIKGCRIAAFDFVAKGTTQLFVQKLFDGHMEGLYFLQLEPEFMKSRDLDIKPFYSDDERDSSAIFDDYYILETVVTSPDPSVDEFDAKGNPVYAAETRGDESVECVMSIQEGIEEFFNEYISIVPEEYRSINKGLDEALLSLVKKVYVNDERFYRLVVEDPFFGRMTDINDVL